MTLRQRQAVFLPSRAVIMLLKSQHKRPFRPRSNCQSRRNKDYISLHINNMKIFTPKLPCHPMLV